MPMLICEGFCNPCRVDINRDVRAFRASIMGEHGTTTPVPDVLAAKLRTLIHTPHMNVLGFTSEFTCTACGATRQFGGPSRPDLTS